MSSGGRRTRGKLRAKSRAKSRKKRRRKRRKSRRKSRRRKNLKKRTKRRRKRGGEKPIDEVMRIIRGNPFVMELKDKGFKKRSNNWRGATHLLISELIKLPGLKMEYIGWGDWSGHSVAIVKAGKEIEKIKIDFESPPDDIDDYYVFDGSFHQILKFEDVKSSENILFTGRLIDYYAHYKKSGRRDTKLSILPVADEKNRDWIVLEDKEYKSILED